MPIIMQCEDCDSTDILMAGAVMKWNFEKQEWVYFDGESAIYTCQDKDHENINCIETEIGDDKEKIIDDAGYIHIKWHIFDVQETAKNMNVSISNDDARAILEDIYRRHDANSGVNWEIIEAYIDTHI